MKKHVSLYLKILGNDGGFEVEGLEDVDSEWLNLVKEPSQVQVALTDGPDWWFYHPKNKNGFGQPTLHFCTHGDRKGRGILQCRRFFSQENCRTFTVRHFYTHC